MHNTCTKHGRNIKTQCIGSTSILLWRKDWSSITHDRTLSSFTTHSQLIVSRKLLWWKLEKSYTKKVYASPRPPPKISLKHDWMKELDSEFAGGSKDSQQIQPKWKTQWSRTGRPVSEQPSGSFTEEIRKDVFLGRESTNSRTVKPVDGLPSSQSCVPMSVKRSNQDKDADENADADQISTVRLVKSEQSVGLFTQCEEIDIDSEVSGLPHAVVKQAENFRIRELVKKIESHPHREALQADLQQNNVHNPFGGDAKAMIREMGNVELFEFCETIPNVQCSECLLYWNLGIVYCSCGQFLVESESRRNFHRWRLDALAIPHNVIRMGSLRGARHGKIEAQKRAFCGPQRAEEMHQNNFWKNSRSFPTRSSISWIATQNWLDRAEVHRVGWICNRRSYLSSHSRGKEKKPRTVVSHIEQIGQECDDATSIRLPSCSHNQEPSPWRIRRRTCRTHSFSTIPEMAPFFLKRFLVELGHVQKVVELMSSIFLKLFVAVGFVYSWRQSTVTDGCTQHTSHVTFSPSQRTCLIMCCTTHWLKCLHEHVISSSWSSTVCGCPFFDPLFLALFLSVCLSFTLLFSSHFDLDTDLNLFLHVVVAKASIPCASAKWVWSLGRKHPSHTWLVRPANESDCTITDYSSHVKRVLTRWFFVLRRLSLCTLFCLHERATICTCMPPYARFVHHHEVTWWL